MSKENETTSNEPAEQLSETVIESSVDVKPDNPPVFDSSAIPPYELKPWSGSQQRSSLQLFLSFIGGYLFNLARLFGYTRRLEAELIAKDKACASNAADERARHRVVEALYKERLSQLTELLEKSERERRLLQDRLLQKAGTLPIFEKQVERSGEPSAIQARDREQRVVERGKAAAEKQKEAIKSEVDKYLHGSTEGIG